MVVQLNLDLYTSFGTIIRLPKTCLLPKTSGSFCLKFVSKLSLYTKQVGDFYTPTKSRSERPRDLKLHRVTSNIKTNRFQVVWDLSVQFLEKFHFCSFCSFRGPGTISGVLHSFTTKFGPIYIVWNHNNTSQDVFTA